MCNIIRTKVVILLPDPHTLPAQKVSLVSQTFKHKREGLETSLFQHNIVTLPKSCVNQSDDSISYYVHSVLQMCVNIRTWTLTPTLLQHTRYTYIIQ